jgi:hypothetical protein
MTLVYPEPQFAHTSAFNATLIHLGFGLGERLGMLIIGFDEGIELVPELFDGREGHAVQRFCSKMENEISTWLSQGPASTSSGTARSGDA